MVLAGGQSQRDFKGGCKIDEARNLFTAKAAADKAEGAAALNIWKGAVCVAANGVAMSVTLANKGKVKVAGTVNGTKVNAKSQLLVGENWCCIPVVVTKKASLAFNLWLPKAGGEVKVTGIDGAIAGEPGTLKSGAVFGCAQGASALTAALAGVGAKLLGDYLPEGVDVATNGGKWVIAKAGKVVFVKGSTAVDEDKAGANPAGLKLVYKEKDGSFKGAFKAPAVVGGKIKSFTVNVTGVVVDVVLGFLSFMAPTSASRSSSNVRPPIRITWSERSPTESTRSFALKNGKTSFHTSCRLPNRRRLFAWRRGEFEYR